MWPAAELPALAGTSAPLPSSPATVLAGLEADLLPPEAYAWWVPLVAAVLLVLVAAWLVFVFWWSNPERVAAREAKKTRFAPAPMTTSLRQRYTDEIDQHLGRYDEGTIDLRELHLELSSTMRRFASERIGTDVTTWTRGDVASYDTTRQLGDLLAIYEEPSFAQRSEAEVRASASSAREVVNRW